MNLADIGRHWARWQPDAVAIRFGSQSTTWRELDVRSTAVAVTFADRGIVKGDRIAILMLNRPEWTLATIAAWKLGAVVVPLNVRFTAAEVAYVVADAGARVVVTDETLAPACSLLDNSVLVLLPAGLAEAPIGADVPEVFADESTPAFLCYTSGTTGDPKGAILTHGSWNVASHGWAQAIELSPHDRVVLPFPLAFTVPRRGRA